MVHTGDRGFHGTEHPDADLVRSRYVLPLERVDPLRYRQLSPLPADAVAATLEGLARMHAWGWGTDARLAVAWEQLHPRPTYWDLQKRGLAQMAHAPQVWAEFTAAFAPVSVSLPHASEQVVTITLDCCPAAR